MIDWMEIVRQHEHKTFKVVKMAEQDRMAINTVVEDITASEYMLKLKHIAWVYPEAARLGK